MPLIIPPFSQFQAPLFPLRGLWNAVPPEGDKYVAAEIDWGSYPSGQAVQFALSGNSPVALSQIVALSVDNSRCGADVRFIFADSGFTLVVPAHAAGVYPVFTNGQMFYVAASNAGASDATSLNIHNSMPPPIPIQLSEAQNGVAIAGINIANGSTVIVPAPTSGTLNTASIIIDYVTTATGAQLRLALVDGAAHTLWNTTFSAAPNSAGVQHFELPDMAVRFVSGLSLVISASTFVNNDVIANVYYTVP
jgi:hypothetical protein